MMKINLNQNYYLSADGQKAVAPAVIQSIKNDRAVILLTKLCRFVRPALDSI
ncbi:hypothetical protein HRI96_10625 [Treponema parvum]|uniref:Uncharacterized protein n=1 Tax=Treponema parvum TaxID=138851 RepID=A0A975F115_9SPIR|nr:hypothetical protein [Treponema parvum]QTQ12611.1 hypothetical protein HRI96_10625 [Treponema parvum]